VIRKIELEKEVKRREIELTKQKKQAERLKRVKLLQQVLLYFLVMNIFFRLVSSSTYAVLAGPN
jgi:hypothetical protein